VLRLLEEAREKLKNPSTDQLTLDIVRVSGKEGRFQVSRWKEPAPSDARWTECRQLQDRIQQASSDPSETLERTDFSVDSGTEPANTFLNAVLQAVMSPKAEMEQTFLHTGELFRLSNERHFGADSGRDMVKKGLAATADRIVRLRGRIRSLEGKERSSFRLWYEEGVTPAFPIRFELRARSFLKLAFEQDQMLSGELT